MRQLGNKQEGHDFRRGNKELVALLIGAAADVEARSMARGQSTPLYRATYMMDVVIMRLLLEAKASVNASTPDGSSPLNIASEQGSDAVVRTLLRHSADVNQALDMGASPLWTASKNGHIGIVHQLISAGARVNQVTEGGETPLFIACEHGHPRVVSVLLAAKAAVSQEANDGSAPLFAAMQNSDYNKAVYLRQTPGQPEKRGQRQCVELLLRAGARKEDAGVFNQFGWVPDTAPAADTVALAAAELAEMKMRHDEREAEAATARKAVELQKREDVAAQRAARAAQPDAPLSSPGLSHKAKVANMTVPPTAVERAKREAAKEAGQAAARMHEAMLREREEARVAHAEQQAELRKIGDLIGRGD